MEENNAFFGNKEVFFLPYPSPKTSEEALALRAHLMAKIHVYVYISVWLCLWVYVYIYMCSIREGQR